MKYLIFPSIINAIAVVLIFLQLVSVEMFNLINPIILYFHNLFTLTALWAVVGIIIICSYEYGKKKGYESKG
jgi:hypothetical protein